MLSKEQAILKAEQLIQQDAQLNLQKIAKLNSFQLWLFKNKLSKAIPLDQQYLLFKVAKQHADEYRFGWKAYLLLMTVLTAVIALMVFIERMFPNSSLFWFCIAMFPMILSTLMSYLKVRNFYIELLQTHLDNNINE